MWNVLSAVGFWLAITLGLWVFTLATHRGADRVAFTLLAACAGFPLYVRGSHVPDFVHLIWLLSLLGAVALDYWLYEEVRKHSHYYWQRPSSGWGYFAILILAILLVSSFVGDWAEHRTNPNLAALLATGCAILLFAAIFFGLPWLASWSGTWVCCPHDVRGGLERFRCEQCAQDNARVLGQHAFVPQAQDPLCTRCGSPMRLRMGKYGSFWGCSRCPACKHTRNISQGRPGPRDAA